MCVYPIKSYPSPCVLGPEWQRWWASGSRDNFSWLSWFLWYFFYFLVCSASFSTVLHHFWVCAHRCIHTFGCVTFWMLIAWACLPPVGNLISVLSISPACVVGYACLLLHKHTLVYVLNVCMYIVLLNLKFVMEPCWAYKLVCQHPITPSISMWHIFYCPNLTV